jgi:rhodanese-related sulfurtransferase
MEEICREELKSKLDRGDEFKLVMTLAEWAYMLSHIPGSINVNNIAQGKQLLDIDDEFVEYCSNEQYSYSNSPPCRTQFAQDELVRQATYHYLVRNGYNNVRRYSGGLADW